MTEKGKKRLRFLGYNLMVVFICLSLMEWYLAAKLNHPKSAPDWLKSTLKTYYMERDWNIIQYRSDCAHYDSLLFYRLNPGTFTFSNREFSTEFQVNSIGLRDDEQSLDFPEVIFLGDSYTMGWGVEQDSTFAQLLEKAWGNKTLNAGISSYGTAREITSLERVKTDSLKYLILQYCPNDLDENKRFVVNNNQLKVSTDSVYQSMVDNESDRKGYYFLKHIFTLPRYFSPAETPASTYEEPEEYKAWRAEKAFLEIIHQSKRIPPSTKIIVFSLEAEQCNGVFVNGVKDLLDRDFTSSLSDRISVIDLSGKIDSSHRFFFDPHLNKKGHKVIAKAIQEHLDTVRYKEGLKQWFYPEGNVSVECNYRNGLKHGEFRCYWPNGLLSRVQMFSNGAQEGWLYDFDQQGDTVKRAFYRNNEIQP